MKNCHLASSTFDQSSLYSVGTCTALSSCSIGTHNTFFCPIIMSESNSNVPDGFIFHTMYCKQTSAPKSNTSEENVWTTPFSSNSFIDEFTNDLYVDSFDLHLRVNPSMEMTTMFVHPFGGEMKEIEKYPKSLKYKIVTDVGWNVKKHPLFLPLDEKEAQEKLQALRTIFNLPELKVGNIVSSTDGIYFLIYQEVD